MEDLLDIDELKTEATGLGIQFAQNIGAEKLKAKIDAHYESQETSGKELQTAIAAVEKSEEKSAENGKKELSKREKITARKMAASVERTVTIVDNDQRVNSQNSTAIVNCSNIHFDLGTAVIPLNVPVKVKQGHINVLKYATISLHVRDQKTGLSEPRPMARYSITDSSLAI